MARARPHRAPAVAVQQPIDRAGRHWMAELGFERLLDARRRRVIALRGLGAQRFDESGFVLRRQIGVPASAASAAEEVIGSQAAIARGDAMDEGDGHAQLDGDHGRRTRIGKRGINDVPRAAMPGQARRLAALIDLFQREVVGRTGDTSHRRLTHCLTRSDMALLYH